MKKISFHMTHNSTLTTNPHRVLAFSSLRLSSSPGKLHSLLHHFHPLKYPEPKGRESSSMSSNRLSEIIMRKWQRLAAKEGSKGSKGHFVVYAKEGKRYVVPLKYLDHPIFQVLLDMAEEEFGTRSHGPLRVPCEEELMEHIVSLLKTKHCC